MAGHKPHNRAVLISAKSRFRQPVLRWIAWIRLCNFETKHIPATQFKLEDGLSQCKPSLKDQPYDNIDSEEFLDAYNNTIYGSRTHSLALSATVSQSAKFLFEHLYIHYSNHRVGSWNGVLSTVPLLYEAELSLWNSILSSR